MTQEIGKDKKEDHADLGGKIYKITKYILANGLFRRQVYKVFPS